MSKGFGFVHIPDPDKVRGDNCGMHGWDAACLLYCPARTSLVWLYCSTTLIVDTRGTGVLQLQALGSLFRVRGAHVCGTERSVMPGRVTDRVQEVA
jgi:hypothetical protein